MLDGLIDLWPNLQRILEGWAWERELAYAFMVAIRFYSRQNGVDDLEHLLDLRAMYESGELTRETLKPALMNFDRFAKRVAERGEG